MLKKLMKPRRIARHAALALGLALVPLPALAETLTDALVSAYNHSGLLEQNRAVLRAADEDVALAVAELRPVLTYAMGASKTSNTLRFTSAASYFVTLNAEFQLFDFGRGQLGVEIAKESVLMTRDTLKGVEQQVLLRAVSAYLSVRSAAERAELQANNVRLIRQELRAARDRFDVGEITQTDVSLAEAALAAAQAAEAAASGALLVAREEYKAATGHYPGTLTAIPAPPVTVDTLEAAKALARARHPDMLAAQRNVSIADMNVELARLAMAPSLTGSFSVSRQRGGNIAGTGGVTLSGPIYMGGKLSALYRKAEAMRDSAKAGLHISQISIDQNVANAWSQLAITASSRAATEQRIRATSVALRGTREEQSLGARTTLDVLNAEQDLLDARASAITAQSDQYTAVYTLLAAMGLLTAEHLKLGLTEYDPEAYYNAVKDAPHRLVSPQGKQLDQVLDALVFNHD